MKKFKRLLSLLFVIVFTVNTATITSLAAWNKDANGNWKYTTADGYVKGWKTINGSWYFFDQNGVMQIGWYDEDGKSYYLDDDGRMKTGWFEYMNKWYYADYSGQIQTGWVKYGNSWYYFNKSGAMQTGWVKYGESWYYFVPNGEMQTGWVKYGNSWYYFVPNGEMQTGWVSYGKSWYYCDYNGEMQTGVLKIDDKIYYLNSDGEMQTGWVKIADKEYEFDSAGALKGTDAPKLDKQFDKYHIPVEIKPPIEEPEESEKEDFTESGSQTPSEEKLYVAINGQAPAYYDVEEVLARVVSYEMSSSFHEEALKAQAVAAHTYIKFHNNLGNPAYVGAITGEPKQKIVDAVSQVKDELIYYNDKPINAVYHASSAGYTASSKDVWGTSYPYLVSVESIYDKDDPNWGVETIISRDELIEMFKENAGYEMSDAYENWFEIETLLDGDYVGRVLVDGKYYTTGRKIRENIVKRNGYMVLKSAKFTVVPTLEGVTFTTYGYGHGVGMPQNGANLYAKNDGWTYDQILTHYYTDTEVK